MFPYLYKYIPITASSNKTVHASIFVNFTQVYALHWNHLATYVEATCGACTVFIPLATAYEGKNIRLRYIPICHCLEFNFIKWEDFSYWVLVLWTKHPESNTFRIKTMQVSLQIDLLTRVISFLFSALLQRPMNINAKHYYILLSFSLPASKLPW